MEIGSLRSLDGADLDKPCNIFLTTKSAVGSVYPCILCQKARADIADITDAGDDVFGGVTKCEINNAIVDDEAGKGVVTAME